MTCFWFYEWYDNHLDLHVLTNSFPTRLSSVLAETPSSPGRRSYNQRHIVLAARREAQLRGVIDQLVHRDRDEIHQHDLGHRTHANNRRTHCRAQDGLLRNEIGRASCRERVCQYV